MNSTVKVDIINFNKEVVSQFDAPSALLNTEFDPVFFSENFVKGSKMAHPLRSIRKYRIQGSTRKIHKQKGTGQARAGCARALGRVGGSAFGANKYPFKTPCRIPKQETLRSKMMIFSQKYKTSCLYFIDNPSFDFHSTKKAKQTFENFSGKSHLVIHEDAVSSNTLLAVRNLPYVRYVTYDMLTSFDILSHDAVFLTQSALKKFNDSALN
jgi:large subunit ribosomal protein L4